MSPSVVKIDLISSGQRYGYLYASDTSWGVCKVRTIFYQKYQAIVLSLVSNLASLHSTFLRECYDHLFLFNISQKQYLA